MAYKGKKLSELKGKELQARIAHLVATHNTAALPTKYLPADQRRSRDMNARLNAPVTPGSPLTNRDLAREANAATGVQYGPQEGALGSELAQTQSHGRAVGDYFNQYLGVLRASTQAQHDQAAANAARIAAIGQSGQQAATSADTSTLQAMQEDARRRGASVDPSLAVNATNAAQVNRNTSDAQAGTANLLGQVGANYLAALQGAAGTQKGQALAQNQRDVSNVRQRQTALATQKGQSNLQYRSKRRSEEFTNVATAALTGQKQDTADAQFSAQTGYTLEQWKQLTTGEKTAALAKIQRAKHPPAKPKQRSQEEIDRPYLTKYGKTYAEFKAAVARGERPKPLSGSKKTPKGKNGKTPDATTGPGSISPSAEQKYVSQINRAAGYLHDGQIPVKDANGNPTLKKAKNRGQVIAWLKAQGIDPRALAVANSLAANNLQGIGGHGVKNAHDLGIHVGGRWKVVKKSAAAERPRG